MRPKARDEDLIVRELPEETMVYDRKRHKAHCLNRTAALIWRHCDGQTGMDQMVTLLRQHDLPASEEVVWLALDRLAKARLLQEGPVWPVGSAGISRRQVMRKLGIAGGLALLPAVTSLAAPTPAGADSATVVMAGCSPCTAGSGLACACISGECVNGLATNCVNRLIGAVCTCAPAF